MFLRLDEVMATPTVDLNIYIYIYIYIYINHSRKSSNQCVTMSCVLCIVYTDIFSYQSDITYFLMEVSSPVLVNVILIVCSTRSNFLVDICEMCRWASGSSRASRFFCNNAVVFFLISHTITGLYYELSLNSTVSCRL